MEAKRLFQVETLLEELGLFRQLAAVLVGVDRSTVERVLEEEIPLFHVEMAEEVGRFGKVAAVEIAVARSAVRPVVEEDIAPSPDTRRPPDRRVAEEET